MNRDKILERILKLLRHAESARSMDSLEEAQTFTTKVQALLAEYKISLVEIEAAQIDRENPMTVKAYDPFEKGFVKREDSRNGWLESLAQVVAEAHFCRLAVEESSCRIYFLGRELDVKVAGFLFDYLVRAIERERERLRDRYQEIDYDATLEEIRTRYVEQVEERIEEVFMDWRPLPKKVDPIWDRSFRDGAVAIIHHRLREQAAKDRQSTEYALVLVRAEGEAQTFADQMTQGSTAAAEEDDRLLSPRGLEAGMAFGSRVDLRRSGIEGGVPEKRRVQQ